MNKVDTITFDIKNSRYWTKDQNYNIMVLRTFERTVNHLVTKRGYIYLNQIYELFEIEWNPERENICFKRLGEQLAHVRFELFDNPDGSILVHICHI